MTENTPALPAEIGRTEITRFNALRHGVLSRYTVLPWESAEEYDAVLAALVAEHAPQGPTEEHLVEELAGILWRKRRLRLAEVAAYRRGLDDTFVSYRKIVKVALVHLDAPGESERVVDAIRATDSDTQEDVRELEENEVMTRHALSRSSSRSCGCWRYSRRRSWPPLSCKRCSLARSASMRSSSSRWPASSDARLGSIW